MNFPCISSLTSFSYATTKLMDSNSYSFGTISIFSITNVSLTSLFHLPITTHYISSL